MTSIEIALIIASVVSFIMNCFLISETNNLKKGFYKLKSETKYIGSDFLRAKDNIGIALHDIKDLHWQIKNPPKYKEGDIHKTYGRITDVKFEKNQWRYYTKNANFIENDN